MKLEIKDNKNYCASVVVIKDLIDLEGCDNIQGTIIHGCHVIVSKDTKLGDIGIYFPVETQIADLFLKNNNLYKDSLLNKDQTKKGFFEKNRRVRAMKLRGFISDGIFLPLNSLISLVDIKGFKENDIFDYINGNKLCEKYVVVHKNKDGSGQGKKGKQPKRISRLVSNQFRFHIDTDQLARNIHKIQPDDLIQITEKLHGTSFISSNIIVKKKLKLYERILKKLGVNIITTEFDDIYSSRKVVKNQFLEKKIKVPFEKIYPTIRVFMLKSHVKNFYFFKYKNEISDELYRKIFTTDNDDTKIYTINYFKNFIELKGFEKYLKNLYNNTTSTGYYSENIWKTINEELYEYISKGMTIYGEAIGFLKSGAYIQKGFDYGCAPREHKIYIYRITYTNVDGKIFEFSAKQVQNWCKLNGLNAVPELFYGEAIDLFDEVKFNFNETHRDVRTFQQEFLEALQKDYLEKDCKYCSDYKNKKVPAEGIVLRKEILGIESYKYKSFQFKEWESKQADKGEINIEDEN